MIICKKDPRLEKPLPREKEIYFALVKWLEIPDRDNSWSAFVTNNQTLTYDEQLIAHKAACVALADVRDQLAIHRRTSPDIMYAVSNDGGKTGAYWAGSAEACFTWLANKDGLEANVNGFTVVAVQRPKQE